MYDTVSMWLLIGLRIGLLRIWRCVHAVFHDRLRQAAVRSFNGQAALVAYENAADKYAIPNNDSLSL